MDIRAARPSEQQAIEAVVAAAFDEESDGRVVRMIRALDETRATRISLVAHDGEVVGHVQLSRAWIDARRMSVYALMLTPLSVAPERHGQGVGTQLLEAALEAADRTGVVAVFLEGDPRFYGPRGFVPGASLGLQRPSARIPELGFQVATLSRYNSWMTGQVIFPDAMWETDITALPLDRDANQRYQPVLTALERVERSRGYGHGDAPPDRHFARAAAPTGAVGDAMRGSRAISSPADSGPQDRLLAHVESAARLTAAYAELAVAPASSGATTAGRWLRLGEDARNATITDVHDRRSPVTAAPIPAADEGSLAGSLGRWHRAALDIAAAGPAAPSADLPLIAAALSTVQVAADAAGIRPSHRGDSTTIWRMAAAAWPSSIRIPGPTAAELRGATSALRADLVTFVEKSRQGDPDQAAGEALAHFASRPGTRAVAVAYRAAVLAAVSTSQPVIAARRLAEVSVPPLTTELVDAATKGRWVPLPATSAPARTILSATIAAADYSYYDRGSSPGLSFDAEAAAARRASSAGFGRSTRDMLQATNEMERPGNPPATAPEQDGLKTPRRER